MMQTRNDPAGGYTIITTQTHSMMNLLIKFFVVLAGSVFLVACGNGNGPAGDAPAADGQTVADFEAEARETIDAENMDDVLDALEAEIAADEEND